MKFYLPFLILLIISCQERKEINNYPNHVGDIAHDESIDKGFMPCHEDISFQYYNFGEGLRYKGEKPAIRDIFAKQYEPIPGEHDDGYVIIRFMVNCEGLTGRYRVETLNKEYIKTDIEDRIVSQLIEITKNLDGWEIGTYEDSVYDYYQYLTFKIENGNLIDIMP